MAVKLNETSLYFNRELSWIQFNKRVLDEALDKNNPLLERLKFAAIFSSNFDEFYMIRYAGIVEQVHARIKEAPADGMSPPEQIQAINTETQKLVSVHTHLVMDELLPELKKKGVRIRTYSTLKTQQKDFLKKFFKEKVFPVLTPLAVDPAHPFPTLKNLGLNLLVELRAPGSRGSALRAVVPMPQ